MAESSNRPKDIFLKALDLPVEERAAFLIQACGGDASLRRQVEAMLQAHAAADSFLEKPAVALDLTVDAVPGRPELRVATEAPGTRIGPYKLLQQLGEGGMGVVFLAEQQEPVRRIVALKIIKQGMDSAQVVARFESERQALALMDHPNIARVLDAGTIGEPSRLSDRVTPPDETRPLTGLGSPRPYFVMELIKGIPITKFCDQEHLTPRQRLELFIPVCQAVQHAHQKGVIHRDLKPSNVMIALYDGKPVPKVIDFGIAKATTQKLTDRTLFTEVGSMVGTLEYMAPEQAELNNLDIDTRADIYALGVLLYELLTGSPPFSAKDLRSKAFTEMLRIIREVEPPRPSTKLSSSQALPAIAASRKLEPSNLTRQVQGDLDWIVMKCLEKDRGRRYETANAVVQDIQRYLTDEPVLAGPPSAGYRLRKFVKRNRGLVTAASVVLLTVVLGIVGTTWGWAEAVQNAGLAEKRRGEAEEAGEANKRLATGEAKARLEADQRREQAETLALRVEFEHYFSKIEDRSDVALVGMASLLPKAARLKDKRLAASLRLHTGALSQNAARLNAICPHQGWVVAVAMSADGTTALTGSFDHTARLWETRTGMQIGPPLQHKDKVHAVALSADGKTALTGSWDRTARLWETSSGKQMGLPLEHKGEVYAVALSADGKTALTAGRDKTARLWETATGKPIGSPLQHQAEVVVVALSADGKTALTGSLDKTARLWDTATGKPIGPPLHHQDTVNVAALSRDGKTALTGSFDNTARLWETATGKPIGLPLPHQDSIQAVALSGDGKTALTGSDDKTARLWDTATGKPIGPPLRHQALVRAVALSDDGKTALTGSFDNTARLWEAATGKPIGPPLPHQRFIQAVALSADGTMAVTGSWDGNARLWESATDKPFGPPLQHSGAKNAVALSGDGRTVLTGSQHDEARLWGTANGKPIGQPLMHKERVISVALSADGKVALTGTFLAARLWDTVTGKPIGPPLINQAPVVAVALSADGKKALMGCQDKSARLWERGIGIQFAETLQHKGTVIAVALSADGKTALTGSTDYTAQLWDTATCKPLGSPLQHQVDVFAVALSADGKIALTGSFLTARLWDTATGKPFGSLPHQDAVESVALSADGKTALTGSRDKAARLWETATAKPIGPPLPHQSAVRVVALSADGKAALTGSDDKTVRMWHVPQPLRGEPERIMLWTQVITGLEVDELTAVRVLDAKTWQERKDRLQKLGGPPVID